MLSEELKIGFLLKVLPAALAEKVVEQLDRLKSYREVHDKVVSLVQSSSKYMLSDEMDCSQLDATVPRDGGVWGGRALLGCYLQGPLCPVWRPRTLRQRLPNPS